eukprot:jgi/Botrbrau1/9702/Bobra.0201s0032.1
MTEPTRIKAAGGQMTVVIKVGTSSLVRTEQNSINLSNLARICETVRDLHVAGHRVVVVSSGAVGVGAQRFRLASRPGQLAQKQALAAVGQVHLMRFYDDFFSALGLTCAQVLLTLDNLASRGQYLNASNTFRELFAYGAIPIVNENDTVAVEELRIGDNDTLSAQVATLVRADWLFLLTDVDALYTANPNVDPSARAIPEVHDLEELQVDTSTAGTQWGTGGMGTKLTAARIATAAGCKMVICSATAPESIAALVLRGQHVGTLFHAHPQANKGRKRWIPSVPVKGELYLDAGAVRAVRERGTSLFSAGIVRVLGDFCAQDAVRLCDASGAEFARGLCNYSFLEVSRIKGLSSKDFKEQLGYVGAEEIVHRDNISLLTLRRRSSSHLLPGGVSPLEGSSGAPSDTEGVGTSAILLDLSSTGRRFAMGPDSASSSRGNSNSPTRLPEVLGCETPVKPGVPGPGPTGEAVDRPGEARPPLSIGVDGMNAGAQLQTETANVASRLALLKERDRSLEGKGAQHAASVPGDDTDWKQMMVRAMAEERSDEGATTAVPAGLDIDEGGWLP